MNKKLIFGLFFVVTFCLGLTIPALAADYTYPLEGAEGVASETEVKTYDKDAWKDNVGDAIKDPTKLWDGDSDEEGAKSKSTIKEYDDDKLDIWDVLELLGFDPEDDLGLNDDAQAALTAGLALEGEWKVWMVTRDAWDFTSDEFDEDPDDEDDEFPVFKDPKDGEEIREEIQAVLAYVYTQGALLQGMDATTAGAYGQAQAALYNGDYLAFMLFVDNGLPMAKDTEDYTEALLKALDCDAVKYKDGVVTVEAGEIEKLNAEEDYTVECTISESYGVVSKTEFLDEDGEVFYSKESLAPTVPGYEVSILLGVSAAASIAAIAYRLKRKR